MRNDLRRNSLKRAAKDALEEAAIKLASTKCRSPKPCSYHLELAREVVAKRHTDMETTQ